MDALCICHVELVETSHVVHEKVLCEYKLNINIYLTKNSNYYFRATLLPVLCFNPHRSKDTSSFIIGYFAIYPICFRPLLWRLPKIRILFQKQTHFPHNIKYKGQSTLYPVGQSRVLARGYLRPYWWEVSAFLHFLSLATPFKLCTQESFYLIPSIFPVTSLFFSSSFSISSTVGRLPLKSVGNACPSS